MHRHRLAACLSLLLVALLAVPLAFDPAPGADARKGKGRGKGGAGGTKTQVVTQTQVVVRAFAYPGAIAIPDKGKASPYPAAIVVSDLPQGKMLDVDVTLRNVSHEYSKDVDILLVAPGGANTFVLSDVGGGAANVTLTLDDEAAAMLPPSGLLASGPYQPTNYVADFDPFPDGPTPSQVTALSTFDGTDPNGPWSLYVSDEFNELGGAIAGGWELSITAETTTTTTTAVPAANDGDGKGKNNGSGKGKGTGKGKAKGKGAGKGDGDAKGKGGNG